MFHSASARWVNVMLGVWLFFSAFFWHHAQRQFNNAWVVGIAVMILATMAVRFDELRLANLVLAVWLFVSLWLLPRDSSVTLWNNLAASVAMFIVASVPNRPLGGPSKHRGAHP